MRRRRAGSPYARLLTESRNPRSRDLDRMPTARVVSLLLDEDRRAIVAAAAQRGPLARAASAAARCLERGGRLVFLGAGTSGRLGVLEAAECPPTFGTDPATIKAVMAGGDSAVFRAVEGAEDREDDGRRRAGGLDARDLLVGISASSVTPFVRGALAAARSAGVETVLLTCAPDKGIRRLADVVVAMRTGPEVLTGSTRLKAGSATKAALNAITTAAMVRLGKAYQNFMVDLRPGSAKLRDRARRIVAAAAGVTDEAAERLLAETSGDTKVAIVMGRLGVTAEEAHRRLSAGRGHVRAALGRARASRGSRRSRKRPRPG